MNTLKYAKKLEEVGYTREQAEMTIGILNEVVESNLATKQDLKDLRAEFRQELQEFRAEFKQDIKDLRHDLIQLQSTMTIRLGAMLFTGLTAMTAIIKLL